MQLLLLNKIKYIFSLFSFLLSCKWIFDCDWLTIALVNRNTLVMHDISQLVVNFFLSLFFSSFYVSLSQHRKLLTGFTTRWINVNKKGFLLFLFFFFFIIIPFTSRNRRFLCDPIVCPIDFLPVSELAATLRPNIDPHFYPIRDIYSMFRYEMIQRRLFECLSRKLEQIEHFDERNSRLECANNCTFFISIRYSDDNTRRTAGLFFCRWIDNAVLADFANCDQNRCRSDFKSNAVVRILWQLEINVATIHQCCRHFRQSRVVQCAFDGQRNCVVQIATAFQNLQERARLDWPRQWKNGMMNRLPEHRQIISSIVDQAKCTAPWDWTLVATDRHFRVC